MQIRVEDRRDKAKVCRDRRLGGEQIQDPLLDIEIGRVERVVFGHHGVDEFGVLVNEGLHGLLESPLGALPQTQDLALQGRQLVVEPFARLQHQPNRPVT